MIASNNSRRKFLKQAAGFTFMIGAGGLISACGANGPDAASAGTNTDPREVNIWVTLHPDNSIIVKYAGTEMGQGSMTHVPMILAEYLDADWDKVTVEIVTIHDVAYGNPIFQNMLYTAGSTHVMVYSKKMKVAGTQARKLLMMAVAKHWNVPLSELNTDLGNVIHKSSDRRMSYGNIVADVDLPSDIPDINDSDFIPEAKFRYIGKQVMRRDVPSKVNGKAQYGMDAQVPGMLYAAILRAPVEGERPLKVDDMLARKTKNVTDIVVLPYGVAVVGSTVEATKKGKRRLKVSWSEDSPFRKASTSASIAEYSSAAKDLSKTGVAWSSKGDASGTMDKAADVLGALYTSEPLYHAQMEPLNATASVSDDGKSAEIWVGTQTQSLTIIGAAETLQTTNDKITLHPLTMGGGFGRRSLLHQEYVDDALLVSRAIKKPVKVIWSREDDLATGNFRTATAQYMRGGFDKNNKLIAVQHRVAAPAILPTMNIHRWDVVKPKDVITMLGSENTSYDIPHHLAEHIIQPRASRVIAFRGVGTGYTKFAMESFIDELAQSQNTDPLEFRLELCHNNPRLTRVIETVAEMARWGTPRAAGIGMGMALSGYHKSLSAGIVELSVDADSGHIQIHKFWAVGDPGHVISPRNTKAQVVGNIIFGLSNALSERITIEKGIVKQSNFNNYKIMRANKMPDIETRIISSDNPSSGAGELGMAMVAPAIANAIAALTGKRIRHQPLSPDVVSEALKA